MSHNCIRKGKILKKNNNLQTRNAGLRAEQEMRDLVPNKKTRLNADNSGKYSLFHNNHVAWSVSVAITDIVEQHTNKHITRSHELYWLNSGWSVHLISG